MIVLAEWIIGIIAVYAAIGVVFAVLFVSAGAGRIDPAARGAGLGFRLLIFPGVAALWPLLASRWLRRPAPPQQRNAHRRAARRASSEQEAQP
jgi:hypothetical protein